MNQPILQVRGLVKRYGDLEALTGIDLDINRGEVFGLLGPNGAGKTTFLSIISSLLPAMHGEVRIDGQTLGRNRDLRRRIGIVPQELAIYADLSARENLAFFGQLYGIAGAQLTRRVERILQSIGLAERADERAAHYSGGMKRRLNLGAALVHEPPLLLLDEPTAGVDPQSRNHIFDEIRRLNADGVTIVYTSHYMEEVQTLCSRIGIIDHGKLIACDTLEGLLRLLPGAIRFGVPHLNDDFRRRLQNLGEGELIDRGSGVFELQCRDVKRALLPFVAIVSDLDIELNRLQIEEPNLERVFLHLTGRGLRD